MGRYRGLLVLSLVFFGCRSSEPGDSELPDAADPAVRAADNASPQGDGEASPQGDGEASPQGDGAEAATASSATPPTGAAENDLPGLAVGQPAPDFSLDSQQGQTLTLQQLRESGPVALVFYRSADWWLFCKRQLVQLQESLPQFTEAGLQVVGVSYDPVPVLEAFSQDQGITFPLLSDTDSQVIRAFGIEHEQGLPHPGTIVVDDTGVIRAKLFLEGYRQRHLPEDLLREARNLHESEQP